MKRIVQSIRPNLAVILNLTQGDKRTTAHVTIIGVSQCHLRTRIEGISTGLLPEAVICEAFAYAYDGIETEEIESGDRLVTANDTPSLLEHLALAYGVPLSGTQITLPL